MGYLKGENVAEFERQSEAILNNSIDIIEEIKKRCNDNNLKEVIPRTIEVRHYVLESGLHVYTSYRQTKISTYELNVEKDGSIRDGEDNKGVVLQELKTRGLIRPGDKTYISIMGKGNVADVGEINDSRLRTTAEHVNYLEPEDETIFDLAENQLKRLSNPEDSREALMSFKEMIDKELGKEEKSQKISEEEIEDIWPDLGAEFTDHDKDSTADGREEDEEDGLDFFDTDSDLGAEFADFADFELDAYKEKPSDYLEYIKSPEGKEILKGIKDGLAKLGLSKDKIDKLMLEAEELASNKDTKNSDKDINRLEI